MYVAFAGGVGGAKLAHGLSRILPPDRLTIAVNTGDDFDHLGYRICPDLDTVMYTLAGIANPETGWGIRDETWAFMDRQERDGGATWFRLGDKDLETHAARLAMLRDGRTLSAATAELSARHGIAHRIVPASDDPVRTHVATTDEGTLPFQDYFVRLHCAPEVLGFSFDGADAAAPAPALVDALDSRELEAVVLCPSNPYVSIGPILAIPEIRARLEKRTRPCVAVSPIVGGKALKGPAAKMMRELGLDPSAATVAEFYRGLVDGFVLDRTDAALEDDVRQFVPHVLIADTVMTSDDDRARLAGEVVAFAESLAG
jgi:LPPG:FO 2-phospho-L-lactate transferase